MSYFFDGFATKVLKKPSEHVRVQGSSIGMKVQIFVENKEVFALIFAKKRKNCSWTSKLFEAHSLCSITTIEETETF